jgi:hypothetical protein
MTPEERFERIESELELAATNISKLDEISRRHSEQIEAHSVQIAQLGDFILRVGRVAEEQGRRMDEFTERLNALIIMVERYLSNGRH